MICVICGMSVRGHLGLSCLIEVVDCSWLEKGVVMSVNCYMKYMQ